MTLKEIILKPSRIDFEDKHPRSDRGWPPEGYQPEKEFNPPFRPQKELIICKIPELDLGEKIVLNAWGSWDSWNSYHSYVQNYRKRLGIYSVSSKEIDSPTTYYRYILKEEKKFSERKMIHKFLSGDFSHISEITKNLKYIALDKDGELLPKFSEGDESSIFFPLDFEIKK